ncbi:MAG: hypothetical protein JJE04_09845 [Acidobacteriia bacterium]|nr:hypothetical protein [Terriglobia bacterium]
MSIYTSFDMIMDCRAGKPEGWLHLITYFTPACRLLLRHYGGGEESFAAFLALLRGKVASLEPAPERQLVVWFRPLLLEAAGYPKKPGLGTLDLEILTTAFADLTLVERQVVWFQTMQYIDADTARMVRASEETVHKLRAKAAELLRANVDNWSLTLLSESGAELGEMARGEVREEPVAFNDYINILDGRLTWANRVPVERSLAASWHEVDHLCRIREADDVLRAGPPLTPEQAAPYFALAGVTPPKSSLWKRLLASR